MSQPYSNDNDPYEPQRISYVPDRVSKTKPVEEVVETPTVEAPVPVKEERKRSPSVVLFSIGLILIAISLFAMIGTTGFYYYANQRLEDANREATYTAQQISAFAKQMNSTATAMAQPTTTATPGTGSTTPTPAVSLSPTTVPDPKVKPTETALASQNPYPTFKTLALYDPLTSDADNRWGVSEDTGGPYCGFKNGAYHAVSGRSSLIPCFAERTNYSDLVFQIQVTILKNGCGGLIFRANKATEAYYYFEICQDGTYKAKRYDNRDKAEPYMVLTENNSPAIKQGLNQANVIAIAAHGSTLDFFVNHQLVVTVTDSALPQGAIGVIADPITEVTEVVYSDATVWIP